MSSFLFWYFANIDINNELSTISYTLLHLVTYEESQNLKLRREDERQRQEERKNEEERKRAEEKRKEEELLAMLAEEQLMCDVDLEETGCASDIEVSQNPA